MREVGTIWRAVRWRHIAFVVALALTVCSDSADLYSTLHQPTRVTGVIHAKDGSVVEGVDVWLSAKAPDSSGLAKTGADGSYRVERQAEKGIQLTLRVTHRDFQPYTTTIIADRQEHEMQITLDRQAEWRRVQFNAGDLAELWTGADWCDAKIIRVGEKDSTTPEGAQDMSGKYYIRVNPAYTGYAEFWESGDYLRPGGLRGNRKCFDDE
jgi:hypothetical protein